MEYNYIETKEKESQISNGLMIDKIKIGWKEYDVNYVEDKGILMSNDDICYGEINHDEGIININKKFEIDQQECTTIHEVLHGIEVMYDIELGEDKVTRLANALFIVLKDNNLKIIKK